MMMAVCAVLRMMMMMMMMMVCVKGSSPCLDWSSKDTECVQMLKHLHTGARITVQMPPDIQGHWVSTSCEVRPGPEFIMRSYRFLHNGSFSALQIYYSDVHCSSPTHTLLVQGRLRLRQASWIVRGGTEADYQIQSTQVVFHSESAAAALGLRPERGCRGISRSWRLNMSYELWSEEKDSECTLQINFTMHELQLLRLEKQHLEPSLEELYLGDIHTQAEHRLTYRPSSYQPALHNARNHDGCCLVCQMVSRSDEFHPPILPILPVLPVVLQGQWVSRRCEVRPEAQFLTRHFIFHDSNSSWEGHYYHYSDPACRHPTFSITARGAYSRGAESARISGATEYIFTAGVCSPSGYVDRVSAESLPRGSVWGPRLLETGRAAGRDGDSGLRGSGHPAAAHRVRDLPLTAAAGRPTAAVQRPETQRRLQPRPARAQTIILPAAPRAVHRAERQRAHRAASAPAHRYHGDAAVLESDWLIADTQHNISTS
ncbi:protein APCDD1-like isoform X1 [Danio aesculapii]|uniref:protein APCDD1-like isoform X1 n=1 Tax=Danio aesculapii TaxID=1142201 RepID=UPI0024C0E221|nr:protein APCDD1-like isoform X1 [Danio aesculapii]